MFSFETPVFTVKKEKEGKRKKGKKRLCFKWCIPMTFGQLKVCVSVN